MIHTWKGFNTSHVTVQRDTAPYLGFGFYSFQYIPCYCSTAYVYYRERERQVSIHPMLLFNCLRYFISHSLQRVSIHPMLLFNVLLVDLFKTTGLVSIHPMLLFNRDKEWAFKESNYVSIHPMLLFNITSLIFLTSPATFQYIPCYCSTI